MVKAVIFDMYETLITHYDCPLYFGTQMAEDAGIPPERFLPMWRMTEYDRTIGEMTLENVLEIILKENDCYSEELMDKIVKKRISTNEECFENLHPEIIPLLSKLKEMGIYVGLISNCFSEEAIVIRKSKLFPYFDKVYLSYEQGLAKPDEEIFARCIRDLGVEPRECIYIGDGGSRELEAAKQVGMKPLQATWYLKSGTTQPTGRKEGFLQLETPLELMGYVE